MLTVSLKTKCDFSTAVAFGNSVFFLNRNSCQMIDACIFSKWNSRSDVYGQTHTKQLLNLLCIVYMFLLRNLENTAKPVLSGHSKIDTTKMLMTNGGLMKVESRMQYFQPALSDNRS